MESKIHHTTEHDYGKETSDLFVRKSDSGYLWKL